MNLDNLKIKYIIGSFKSDPLFPTLEDLEFYISSWLNSPDGIEFNETRNKKEGTSNILYFSEYLISLKIGLDDKSIIKSLLIEAENLNLIEKINKTSEANQIYKIKKFKF